MSYWSSIEPAFDAVNIYDGEPTYLEGCSRYPRWIVELLAVHWFASEVSNGGLRQFFDNSTGIVAPEALQGLHRIGQREASDALRQAMSLFGPEFPREADARALQLERLGNQAVDALAAAEDRLYEHLGEDLGAAWDAMDAYARNADSGRIP